LIDSETVSDSIYSASIQRFAISPDTFIGRAGPGSVRELTVERAIAVDHLHLCAVHDRFHAAMVAATGTRSNPGAP
jgi:hypothetical protein